MPNGTKLAKSFLWKKCDSCNILISKFDFYKHDKVCPECNYHFPMYSSERINHIIDLKSWIPLYNNLLSGDPLGFCDKKPYITRLAENQKITGLDEAVQTGIGRINNISASVAVMDFNFMGGSMGSAVGEKITRLVEFSTKEELPIVIISASGGARMQEGILSLMQMAKISAALERLQSKGLLYISILSSPTTGGVFASFAMLGDIILAEPKAVVGFAGKRVVEQTLNEKLPPNFQSAEYLLDNGFVDLIVKRKQLKKTIHMILDLHN
uniref:Acetyl-coenzyme A carboxylase carboxyl transferase subunit beta, chloroplastic n=1 Tax=Cyanidium caldarium TaxID=2771 RepID=ACCD_CYACA|nr:acetyl-CoA carboxylase beta subunit [Cyanidium caldarium]Q9TLW3.1 RecName: Full=Acetyl-coenzyme A carboxylase carboxyl transferase subunit beta, chloroplastic; Short=ACCase subunit beta; Short=Acetyl-CoA carboxylase carboxyltransferase subunit beta [Cyanidium caldarium]AAF12939.1 unknown [Cyanidium caldarium]WDB00280.1 acetyl-CoA carboxylase beta subunit [Cyanidium caldarium]